MLACSMGGEGHLVPLVNVGRSLQRAGHEAMLLVVPALAPSAKRSGLPYRVGDEPSRQVVATVWERVRAGPADAVVGLMDRELFGDRCTAAMLPAAREARDAWRHDLVLREPCEYASAVAAHEADVPQAQVAISLASVEFDVLGMVAPVIDRFSRGVSAKIGSSPYLSSFPPSLDPSPWSDTRRLRTAQPADDTAIGWGAGEEEPLVYVTFGTVLGHLKEAVGVFRTALDAVAGLRARVLLTVGRATDVADIGPIPPNTRVEQWVPQRSVLRDAALVVCHGGAGTTFGALGAGVPLVICPLFADQAQNGEVVQRAGAGVVVARGSEAAGGLGSLGPSDVAVLRSAIEEVLGDPAYRVAAGRVGAEVAGLPALATVIERLVRRDGAM